MFIGFPKVANTHNMTTLLPGEGNDYIYTNTYALTNIVW